MHELELDPGANAMLIATAVSWTKEWTADGRSDDECAANLVWGGSWQVTVPPERAIDKERRGELTYQHEQLGSQRRKERVRQGPTRSDKVRQGPTRSDKSLLSNAGRHAGVAT